jgi:hypothetical protein
MNTDEHGYDKGFYDYGAKNYEELKPRMNTDTAKTFLNLRENAR